jgi:hypothetical protein
MNAKDTAKDFGIRHGEKVAVVLSVLLCAWIIYGVLTDQTIRPKDISMDRINEMWTRIDDRRANAKSPELKRPPPYFDDMRARWSIELPSGSYYPWLSTIIDVGPPDNDDLRLFVYNLHPPTIKADDQIGTVELTITPPAVGRATDPRVSSDPKQVWHTDKKDRKVENTVEQIGVVVEVKVGGGEWQPIKAKGVGATGVLTFKENGPAKLVFETTEPWVRHSFRARTIARATGYPLDKPIGPSGEIPDATVLVFAGDYPDDPIDWKAFAAKLGHKDPDAELAGKFLAGKSTGPGAVGLRPGELVYISDNSDEQVMTPTSSIRFVFMKPIEDPTDPTAQGAELEVNKLIRDAKGENGKWLTAPVEYKLVKKGDPLKFQKPVPDPQLDNKKKMECDFDTPFTLVEVQKDVKRVEFYEVRAKSRAGGGRDKDLEVKTKEIQTEAAVLESSTGQKLTLVKLAKIQKPPHPAAIVYPNFPSLLYDESLEFKKDPAAFQQWGLIPTPPIEHDPGTGPLEDWRKKSGNNLLSTDTKYFELADGRLVYWENVNKTLEVYKIPGSESDIKPIVDTPTPEAPKTPADAPKNRTTPPAHTAPRTHPTPAPAPVQPGPSPGQPQNGPGNGPATGNGNGPNAPTNR